MQFHKKLSRASRNASVQQCFFVSIFWHNLSFFARSAQKIFQDFQGQTTVFDTFFARSAKKILGVFKGKMKFLALFRAKRAIFFNFGVLKGFSLLNSARF